MLFLYFSSSSSIYLIKLSELPVNPFPVPFRNLREHTFLFQGMKRYLISSEISLVAERQKTVNSRHRAQIVAREVGLDLRARRAYAPYVRTDPPRGPPGGLSLPRPRTARRSVPTKCGLPFGLADAFPLNNSQIRAGLRRLIIDG